MRRGGVHLEPEATEEPTKEDLADVIRAAIMAGELLPNERLVETDLAARYHVGRSVVRLALTKLEKERLVVREPNKGVRVRAIPLSEAIEITEVRASLEELIAEKAAQNASEEDLEALGRVVTAMETAAEALDVEAYSRANRELHQILYRAADHATALWMLEVLRAQAVRWQFRVAMVPGRMEVSVREHAAIVEAILRRDGTAARRAMSEHMQGVLNTLRRMPKEGLY